MNKLFLLLLGITIILVGCVSKPSLEIEEQAKLMVNSPLTVRESFQDLGTIAMDQGDLKINYLIRNDGDSPVVIKTMNTSCACTSAKLKIGDKESRRISMTPTTDIYMVLAAGAEAELDVSFDPKFHGPNDTGIKRRTLSMETNSAVNPTVDLSFQVNVVKTAAELPNKKEFDFEEREFDFGLLKQSAGIVEHDFSFTYNGDEDLEIIGVPTSCGCTSARINRNNLSKGDKGIITVSFDPNLHAEPEGRFFKTVSLLTNPPVPGINDLKIWAEIDLDLGIQAYKLKSDHAEKEDDYDEAPYNSISPIVFDGMMKNKDFVLVDVHIPEQDQILGTDLLIPYNNIKANLDKLPQDKNTKIVVYCLSGSMSRAAAYILGDLGYTNVYDLSGGKKAYDEINI